MYSRSLGPPTLAAVPLKSSDCSALRTDDVFRRLTLPSLQRVPGTRRPNGIVCTCAKSFRNSSSLVYCLCGSEDWRAAPNPKSKSQNSKCFTGVANWNCAATIHSCFRRRLMGVPSPEQKTQKFQVLHLVSLRNRNTIPSLSLSCTEVVPSLITGHIPTVTGFLPPTGASLILGCLIHQDFILSTIGHLAGLTLIPISQRTV